MRYSMPISSPLEAMYETARKICAITRNALSVVVRVLGFRALTAAERHLMSLDDRTLVDLGFDPRNLPMRDQLRRRQSATSACTHTVASLDFGR